MQPCAHPYFHHILGEHFFADTRRRRRNPGCSSHCPGRNITRRRESHMSSKCTVHSVSKVTLVGDGLLELDVCGRVISSVNLTSHPTTLPVASMCVLCARTPHTKAKKNVRSPRSRKCSHLHETPVGEAVGFDVRLLRLPLSLALLVSLACARLPFRALEHDTALVSGRDAGLVGGCAGWWCVRGLYVLGGWMGVCGVRGGVCRFVHVCIVLCCVLSVSSGLPSSWF